MIHMVKRCWPVVAVGCCLLSAPSRGGGFSWSVGPVYRHGMGIEASGTSYAQDLGLGLEQILHQDAPASALGGRGLFAPGGDAGALPIGGYANRNFDDGFVYMDAGTGVSGSLAPDHTWYWSYAGASQYDATAGTLTFHRDVTLSRAGQVRDTGREIDVSLVAMQSQALDHSSDVAGWGIEAIGGWSLGKGETCAWALLCGVNGIVGKTHNFRAQTLQQDLLRQEYEVVTIHTYVDTYHAEDGYIYALSPPIVPPPAPYVGTYGGSPGSPLIPNAPSSRVRSGETVARDVSTAVNRTMALSETLRGYNTMDVGMETSVYQVWTGVQAMLFDGVFKVSLCPKISLNLVDLDVERREFYWLSGDGAAPELAAEWSDTQGKSEFVFGLGCSGAIGVNSESGWFLNAVYGYDWLTEDVVVWAGPNAFRFDASGFTAGLQFGKRL